MFLRAIGDNAVISFKMIGERDASRVLKNKKFISFVGHQATADYLTKKMEVDVPHNRKIVKLREGEEALLVVPDLFTVKDLYGQMRIPEEVKEFSEEEMETLRFQYILITRLDKRKKQYPEPLSKEKRVMPDI